ncbi:hypothetical protein LCGC14_0838720 [marine sediment metagenome]|uniref:Uncharacterized protein n=1 Tax=marine sediment metagenome TaxID=412755 RepID=A0A0F9SL23_9ZZZZ
MDTNPRSHTFNPLIETNIRRLLQASLFTDEQRERVRKELKLAHDRKERLPISLSDVHVFQIIDGLRLLREKFHDTENMIGHNIYQKTPYNFLSDIKAEVHAFYLSDPDPKKDRAKRKMFNALYWLVLVPTIDIFREYSHEDALYNIDAVITSAIDYVKESDVASTEDDAFIARVLLGRDLEKRFAIRNIAAKIFKLRSKTKKRRKKRK